MRIPTPIKTAVYSAVAFFGTLLVLSVGYAAYSALSNVDVGDPLSKDAWNAMVADLEDLNARWTRSGGNIAFTGGNVGIGTASPVDKLEVVGGIRSSGSAANYGLGNQVTMDYNGGNARINSVNPPTGTATLSLMTNSVDRIYINATGNVGIGTTTPSTKLEVNGVVTAANINQAPFVSTTNRSSVYTTVNTASWQYMGTSVTFTVPSGPNRKYRISARMLWSSSGNYMYAGISSSSSTLTGQPIWSGPFLEYINDPGWHTASMEWYVDLAPGTYTYYLMVYGGPSYITSYHHDPTYTNIMVWPL